MVTTEVSDNPNSGRSDSVAPENSVDIADSYTRECSNRTDFESDRPLEHNQGIIHSRKLWVVENHNCSCMVGQRAVKNRTESLDFECNRAMTLTDWK